LTKNYAIYVSNGSMKTSFTKTFTDLPAGQKTKEERFNHDANVKVLWNEKIT